MCIMIFFNLIAFQLMALPQIRKLVALGALAYNLRYCFRSIPPFDKLLLLRLFYFF
jgi:hypothetical protein